MASFLKNAFGGEKAPEAASPDSDFADFAEAPSPAPEVGTQDATVGSAAAAATQAPYTKWYNVHERHSISEFRMEGLILLVSSFIFLFHMIGARRNRSRAKGWMRAHAPIIQKEYALVGFGGVPTVDNENLNTDTLIKEKSLFEFATYATGRQNTAFTRNRTRRRWREPWVELSFLLNGAGRCCHQALVVLVGGGVVRCPHPGS
jgi:hypothetical protein